MGANGLPLLGLRLSREGGVVDNHVVRAVDDAHVRGDLRRTGTIRNGMVRNGMVRNGTERIAEIRQGAK